MNEICLDECVKKVEMKQGKTKMWVLPNNNSCDSCPYVGVVKVSYCRNANLYKKIVEEQLYLPFK